MTFFARVFSLVEDIPSRSAICDELLDAGHVFATSPGKDEDGFKDYDWTSMDFQYDENLPLIHLERNTEEMDGELFRDEIKEFIEAVDALPYEKNTKKVKSIFSGIKQIYAFKLEEEMDEKGWELVEDILDFIKDSTDGYVQIDGEGIYDKEGKMMLEFA